MTVAVSTKENFADDQYLNDDGVFRVLLVGDGNFSFTLALCQLLFASQQQPSQHYQCAARRYLGIDDDFPVSSIRITATSFDSREELVEKYADFAIIAQKLAHFPNVTLEHRINAWTLLDHFPSTRFHRIIWNHPHLGTENLNLHRFLMAHFFRSVSEVLSPLPFTLKSISDASFKKVLPNVCISLVQGQETRWQLVHSASSSHFVLAVDPFIFEESKFPGYVCKRNKTGHSFKNQATKKHMRDEMVSFVYRFFIQKDHADAMVSEMAQLAVEEVVKQKPQQPRRKIMYDPAKYESRAMRKQMAREQNVEFECHQCGKLFPSLRGIRQHFHMMHELELFSEDTGLDNLDHFDWPTFEKIDNQYVCPSCITRVFKHLMDVQSHWISQHSGSGAGNGDQNDNPNVNSSSNYRYYPCEVCGQAVEASPMGMFVHLESLKPVLGLKMQCPCCRSDTRTFTEKRALEQHVRFCQLRHN